MNLRHFTASFQFVADVLGGKRGTKVAVGGTRAFAVPGHIQIPSLPPSSRRAVRRGRMYLDHESAHQRFTDFEAWRNRATGPVLEYLNNILEDVRCELLASQKYLGCAVNLRDGIADLVDEGEIGKIDPDSPDPHDWFFQWFLAHTRSTYLGQTALLPTEKTARALLGTHTAPVLGKIEGLCRRIPLLSDTKGALDLAKEIFDLLGREAAGQPGQEGEGEGGTNSQERGDPEGERGRDGSEGPEKGGAGGGASPEQANERSDPSGGNPNDADSDEEASGTPASSGDETEPETLKNGSAERESPTGSRVAGGRSPGQPQGNAPLLRRVLAGPPDPEAGKKYDLGEVLKKDLEESAGPDRNPFQEFILPGVDVPQVTFGRRISLQEVRRESTALRVRLCGLVQSSRLLYTFPKQTGKRLSAKHLHRVAAGDCRIWETKVREEDVNTSGVFLLDRSDSMEWGGEPYPIEIASRAVLAAMDALRGIPGFASAAAAFPGVPNPRQRARGDWEDYDTNSVALLTGFDEPLVKTVPRYGISANGGTPLAMALWWGIWQLLLRPEPRKILLVATDGRPDEPTTVHRALERAEELGIETFGIGIKLPDIEKFFPKPRSRLIQDVKELPGALFGMLQENLTRRRAA